MSDIKLGMTVRDLTSGLTGIAASQTRLLNGNLQYGIQPKMRDGEASMPDSINVDWQQLEVVDAGISDRAIEPQPDVNVDVGDTVCDLVTEIGGIAIAQTTFINGCVYFTVQPLAKKGKTTPPNPLFVSHERLVFIAPSKFRKKSSEQASGGPSSKAPRSC